MFLKQLSLLRPSLFFLFLNSYISLSEQSTSKTKQLPLTHRQRLSPLSNLRIQATCREQTKQILFSTLNPFRTDEPKLCMSAKINNSDRFSVLHLPGGTAREPPAAGSLDDAHVDRGSLALSWRTRRDPEE